MAGATQTGTTDPAVADGDLAAREERLEEILRRLGSVVLGYSGGVDSTLLLAKALEVLGAGNVLAVTAATPTYAAEEVDEAVRLAERLGARHARIESSELEDEGFLANPPERCYYCKTDLYGDLRELAAERGYAAVIDGSQADDELDWRPGLKALDEQGIASPLREAGLSKADVRELSRRLGLPTAEKPANACLASRFPYGNRITPAALERVGRAERAARALGFDVVRVRDHGDVARIEVPPERRERLLAVSDELVPRLKALGYVWVAIDAEGYRSGSMNEALGQAGEGGRVSGGPEDG
ncbi:MAG: ATP-dependent sacrificial sulfur transferase LarE [Gemmatimonadota bacterium]|nr:ATP-dependent sacrificial sulfur transferase LarE [Gemmatimonadota bacterium]